MVGDTRYLMIRDMGYLMVQDMGYLTVQDMIYLMVREMRYLMVHDLRYMMVQTSFLTVLELEMKHLIPHINSLISLIVLNLGYMVLDTCSI